MESAAAGVAGGRGRRGRGSWRSKSRGLGLTARPVHPRGWAWEDPGSPDSATDAANRPRPLGWPVSRAGRGTARPQQAQRRRRAGVDSALEENTPCRLHGRREPAQSLLIGSAADQHRLLGSSQKEAEPHTLKAVSPLCATSPVLGACGQSSSSFSLNSSSSSSSSPT